MREKKRDRNNFKAILNGKTWPKMHSLKIEMWRTYIDVNRALNHTPYKYNFSFNSAV
jgi:hypothetical protein